MLIDVLAGRDSRSAIPRGSYHFACVPKAGEEIEIEGGFFNVMKAWHRPDLSYQGAKFVILVSDRVDRTGTGLDVRADAGAEM
ncbi:MAG TPA: hypothetical protein VF503_06290 [Sphingobium sp.]|uniref:hypothetical protein n=1 Tax=Sphingobium sp. TaxID=1912891 RepID=UPI002ED22EA2